MGWGWCCPGPDEDGRPGRKPRTVGERRTENGKAGGPAGRGPRGGRHEANDKWRPTTTSKPRTDDHDSEADGLRAGVETVHGSPERWSGTVTTTVRAGSRRYLWKYTPCRPRLRPRMDRLRVCPTVSDACPGTTRSSSAGRRWWPSWSTGSCVPTRAGASSSAERPTARSDRLWQPPWSSPRSSQQRSSSDIRPTTSGQGEERSS
jgi:hypothetical protein